MAVILGVAAALLLVVAVLTSGDPGSMWLRGLGIVAQWAGLILLLAAIGFALRRRAAKWAQRILMDVAGPAMIQAMPPGDVLRSVLRPVYGNSHDSVATGILGGAGRDPARKDVAVSRGTSAKFRVSSLDDTTCLTEYSWTHEYSGIRDNHFLILFATFDRRIRDIVVAERVYPLFEVWRVRDEDALEDFVTSLDSLKVGVSYRDADGVVHEVDPVTPSGQEIALRAFDQFVRLPDDVNRQDLRIVQIDLHDLADPDHVVAAIEQLSLRVSVPGPIKDGYVTWSPPHPCLLKTAVFDVRDLVAEEGEFVFRVLRSDVHVGGVPDSDWAPAKERIEVHLDTWMLPGHGLTLLWRLAD
jgi:hypothetical protein